MACFIISIYKGNSVSLFASNMDEFVIYKVPISVVLVFTPGNKVGYFSFKNSYYCRNVSHNFMLYSLYSII